MADLLPPVAPPVAAPRPPGPRYQAPGQAVTGRDQSRPPDWQPPGLGLLSLSAGVAAVALSVLLPVAGTAISLAAITLLRAADRAQHALTQRRSRYGARPSDIAVVIGTAPWTVVRAALTTVLLAPLALLVALPDRLRAAQAAFEATGGLHATGLFAGDGRLLWAREDVGRHNAMDKVIGRAFLDARLPLADCILCVSGRLSFELVQKAAVAGCPVVVAVGAPSSLAVSLAEDRGVTLCGFVRGGTANVYTQAWRIEH
jgi:hypothetical protein